MTHFDHKIELDQYFDKLHVSIKDRSKVWSVLAKYIQKDIPENAIILELGAGYCDFINNIKGKTRYAVDLNKETKKYCEKDVKFYNLSCTDLKVFHENSIDTIFASNLFEHLTPLEFQATVDGVKRILRPGGRLIILQPNFYYGYREYFFDYTHKSIFTHVGLSDFLVVNGFRIRKLMPRLLPASMQSKYGGTNISRIPFLKLLIQIYLKLPFKLFAKQMYIVAEKNI